MSRIRTSIDLVKTCWSVLRQDRSLLWLPAMSFAASALTIAMMASGVFLTGTHDVGGPWKPSVLGYLIIFLAYLALSTITIFFNAALISAADERLGGGDPTVATALAGAAARFSKILPWAIVSATVSTLLRSIQQRAGLLGRLVIGLVGIAWSLITFLVLPIIVMEGLSVRDAIKRSKELFVRTWGEQMVGNAAISVAAFLALLAAVPVVGLAVLSGFGPLVVVAVVVAVAWICVVSAVAGAMSAIFQTALYRFASTGDVPVGFTPEQLSGAFVPKRSPRLRSPV